MKQYITPRMELEALMSADVITWSGLHQADSLAEKDALASVSGTYWLDDAGRME